MLTNTNKDKMRKRIIDWAIKKLNFNQPASVVSMLFNEKDISYLHSLYEYQLELNQLRAHVIKERQSNN